VNILQFTGLYNQKLNPGAGLVQSPHLFDRRTETEGSSEEVCNVIMYVAAKGQTHVLFFGKPILEATT